MFYDGTTASGLYSSFSLGDELSTNYALEISGFSGTPGMDAFNADARYSIYVSNGMQFTTIDRDNDDYLRGNCAVKHGGWWHRHCSCSAVNKEPFGHWVRLHSVTSSTLKMIRL